MFGTVFNSSCLIFIDRFPFFEFLDPVNIYHIVDVIYCQRVLF